LFALGAMAGEGSQAPERQSLEEITVTAIRLGTRVDQVPATVSVFSAARIERQLVENIEDLVRYEPGVSVRTAPARFTATLATTGRDGHSGFNIRGLEGNRVLIQVDGVRTPDAFSFGAQSVGRGDYVDLGLLKSVEILRGPASALYGSDGVAGAVSFVTRDPGELLGDGRAFSARVHSSYADVSESFSNSLLAAGRAGGWEMLAAYTRRDGKQRRTGGDNDSANTDRTTANPEDNRSNAALLRVVRGIGAAGRLRFTWDHLDRDVDWNVLSAITKVPASGILPATAVIGLTAFDATTRNRFTLDHDYAGRGGWIDGVKTSLSWQSSKTRQFSAEDRYTAADRTRDAHFNTRVLSIAMEGRSSIEGGKVDQRLVYGIDAARTRQQSLRDGTVPPAGERFPSRAFPVTDYTLLGLFAQDELRLGDLVLFPALRWDYFELEPREDPLFTSAVPARLSDSHLSPKLGLLYRLGANWNVFANLATGFKAPEPAQVNNGFANPAFGYTSVSNPDLKPETSRTLEVGVRRTGGRWSAALTGFSGRYEDFIDMAIVGGSFTPADPAVYQYVNLAEAKISGVEFKSSVGMFDGLQWTLATAYARGSVENQGDEAPLDSVDPLRVVTGLDWHPPGRPFGGQFVYTFARRKEQSRIGSDCGGAGCYVPGSYGIVDVIGWWQPARAVMLRAGLFNALDKHYANWSDVRGLSRTSTTRDAYFEPGRHFSASVTVRF
jgi:hemoglobin/transferrin/lactoferrin receptor protein